MLDESFFEKNQVMAGVATMFDDVAGFTFFIKDKSLRYVAYNKRIQEIFKVKRIGDVLGKRDDDFLPENLVKNIRRDDLMVLETGKAIINHVELIPRSYQTYLLDWTTTTKKPLRNQFGEICGVIGVTRPFDQANATIEANEVLGDALDYIKANYRENISILNLAKKSHLSQSSFLRKFKACFGITPKEYIRTLKVQDASYQLFQTNKPMVEVAFDCGFSDQSHFSREFTKIMKESPSSYRNRFRV